MPNALRIGLLGPLQVQDEAGRVVPVGGRQLRVLFTLLALNAGRVVPAASMAEQIWPDDPPGKPGNALQTLVSRLRAELRHAGLPRHRTRRAVVDWSWDLLSVPEQVLARRMAIFPGGATLPAAKQVCADERLPPAAVLPALSGLVDKSILAVAEGPDGADTRYRMLETVRAYGLERLADTEEEAAVRNAFTAHYLNLAETADPGRRGTSARGADGA